MAIFELSNGEKFEKEGFNGRYIQVLGHREKIDKEGNCVETLFQMPDKFKNSSDKRVTTQVRLGSLSAESFDGLDTYLLAENKEYKEYPLVTYYDGEFAINVKPYHKVEVVIQVEEYTKRFFVDWKGNISFYDFIQHIDRNLLDDIAEGKLKEQGIKYIKDYQEQCEEGPYMLEMQTDEGETLSVYLRENELLNSIISARVIEFELNIIE